MTVDAQILSALRESDAVSGADLAQRLGISRAAIWARIEDLRKLGFDIEASPHHGYRLSESPDMLLADDLVARLGEDVVIGREIIVYRETASTNDIVERLAREGAAEGLVVFAESQSKGRGRLGRRWHSPPGMGLFFSVLLRPKLRPMEATQLTVAAATALVRAIDRTSGVRAEIKWPNDLLVDGRKLAGVLTELSAELDTIKHVTLGIGLDVNQSAADFPPELRSIATSLRIASGQRVMRPDLATAVLQELGKDYARIVRGDFEQVADEWEARCTTIGRNVVIRVGDREVRGRAESLDHDGALIVRTQHGRQERIIGGDVSLEK
ncbi:MAG TPA: biotin--[acetyl-CoA-carboxylase] ligase [Verrucomicrobiales bacterium]|nr:biotin--[acetyl-CoA-carboxylase] ligase [Verrucomicrobiales bacterium]